MTDKNTALTAYDGGKAGDGGNAPAARSLRQAPAENALTGMVGRDPVNAYKMAETLASAGEMVPESYRDKPQAIFAAMVKGEELGLGPMQALSAIAVVNGRPTVWGDALRALVQRAGHHVDCEIQGDGDNRKAVATLTRANGKRVVREFSMQDARTAGLLNKKGPWTAYPARMLMNRATAFAVRDGAADALMGMRIQDEEADYGPNAARDVTPQERPAAPRAGGVAYVEDEDDTLDEVVNHTAAAQEPHGAPAGDGAPAGETGAPDVAAAAQEAAQRGVDAFRAFWKDLGPADRDKIRPDLEAYKATASRADAPPDNDDDPFAGDNAPPSDERGEAPDADPVEDYVAAIEGKLEACNSEAQVADALEAFNDEMAYLAEHAPDRHKAVMGLAETMSK